jgi:hypothetical protein
MNSPNGKFIFNVILVKPPFRIFTTALVLWFFTLLTVFPQTNGFQITSRYSFYSYEKNGEIILNVPASYVWRNIGVTLLIGNDTIGTWKGVPRKNTISIPISFNFTPSEYEVSTSIKYSNNAPIEATGTLTILEYKSNEVKIDRLTGGLIVDKRSFFPFGFYCYSPVQATLPEEEVVNGFNMISPYQQILPQTLDERKAYMDRCAQLGMKVHYNLLSVSGGGGVGSQLEGISPDSINTLLINEIKTFMDHPALLGWYISDEPFPSRIAPDSLLGIYEQIKKIDPWHPISIVFMTPFTSTAKQYANALDIVIADPYPVPDMQPSYTGTVAKSLYNEFGGKNPVWIATQSFGGGEIWKREPTPSEVRLMTYQSIINGATGIQFFIRHGLNIFPKSTATWAECGKMAVEIQELTPWLFSNEQTIPVTCSTSDISILSKQHSGKLMIMVANKTNIPRKADFSVSRSVRGKANVLFQNRNISIISNSFSDYLGAYGTQVYLIDLNTKNDTIKPFPGNLIIDPGFEELSSPGVPSACYAWNIGDRGATYFTDSRDAIEGYHSIRLVTPKQDESIRLRFFPFNVKGGSTYYITIWAKGDKESSPDKSKPQYFEISLGNYGKKQFVLTDDWKQYIQGFYVPYDENTPTKLNVTLTMSSPGKGWFDMVQVFEGSEIKRSMRPDIKTPFF